MLSDVKKNATEATEKGPKPAAKCSHLLKRNWSSRSKKCSCFIHDVRIGIGYLSDSGHLNILKQVMVVTP